MKHCRITDGEFKDHIGVIVAGPTAGGQYTVLLIGETRRRDFFDYELVML